MGGNAHRLTANRPVAVEAAPGRLTLSARAPGITRKDLTHASSPDAPHRRT